MNIREDTHTCSTEEIVKKSRDFNSLKITKPYFKSVREPLKKVRKKVPHAHRLQQNNLFTEDQT